MSADGGGKGAPVLTPKSEESRLTKQIVIRIDDALYDDLVDAAEANERTVAGEVRYRLRRSGLGEEGVRADEHD